MDLASVVAALASVGVRVSGSTPNSSVQGDSSRACPTGLAGPEPSGTINNPGQHFHIYIDDLLIATPLGKNFDECLKLHEEQVRKVLEVLRQEKLLCGPKKWLCLGRWDKKTGPREHGCPAAMGKA